MAGELKQDKQVYLDKEPQCCKAGTQSRMVTVIDIAIGVCDHRSTDLFFSRTHGEFS
jgi:hypothetical protein